MWRLQAGVNISREDAETWDGRLEYEGNLGRTDVRLGLGAGRNLMALGVLTLGVDLPLLTRSSGEQVDFPVSVSLQWSR